MADCIYRFPDTYESWCIEKLKAAGIPIRGVLLLEGVERGILTRYTDFEKDEIVYEW